jgi:hypothetical protein
VALPRSIPLGHGQCAVTSGWHGQSANHGVGAGGSPTTKAWQSLRENKLHDFAYTPLHEMQDRADGKGKLTVEVVGVAEEDGVKEENWQAGEEVLLS